MAASFCLEPSQGDVLLHAPPGAPYLRLHARPRVAIGARPFAKGLADRGTRSATAGCAGGGLHAGDMSVNMRVEHC